MRYTSKLFSTGAVRKTPQKVMDAMLGCIGHGPYQTIVEIGAGQGELTGAVLQHHLSFDAYHVFEIDMNACDNLQSQFPALTVHQANAFEYDNHLIAGQKISLFLSSIPLSFYPRAKVEALITSVKKLLDPGGKIVIIFTAVWLIPTFRKSLPGATIQSFFTFPPYFILTYNAALG